MSREKLINFKILVKLEPTNVWRLYWINDKDMQWVAKITLYCNFKKKKKTCLPCFFKEVDSQNLLEMNSQFIIDNENIIIISQFKICPKIRPHFWNQLTHFHFRKVFLNVFQKSPLRKFFPATSAHTLIPITV